MQVLRVLSTVTCLGARLSERTPLLRSIGNALYGAYFNRAAGPVRLFRGLYASFSEASDAIPKGRLHGYDNEASAVRLAHDRFGVYPCDYPILFWLSRLLPDCRLLFDWGGYTGTSYFGFRRYIPYPASLSWVISDVPAVVEEGQRIVAGEQAPGLKFTVSLEELKHADLLLAAGVFQFIEEPFTLLARSPTLPRHILLNKVPSYNLPGAFTLHNLGSALCPYQLFNREALLQRIQALGYRLEDEWLTPDLGCRIPFHREHSIPAFSGFYLRKVT